MNTTIQLKALKAVALAAAKKDVRYYLNGVYLDSTVFHESKSVSLLVATDGHRLHAFRDATEYAEPSTTGNVIIPLDMVNAILKAGAGKNGPELVDISVEDIAGENGRIITAKVGAVTLTDAAVDGTFPDFRRVIPKSTDNAPAHYQGRYIADIATAAQYLTGRKDTALNIKQNGTNAGLVFAGDCPEFLAVIMPVKSSEPDCTVYNSLTY